MILTGIFGGIFFFASESQMNWFLGGLPEKKKMIDHTYIYQLGTDRHCATEMASKRRITGSNVLFKIGVKEEERIRG